METTVIQIGTVQSILGVISIFVIVRIAYGSIKSDTNHIKESLDEIRDGVKDIKERFIVTEYKNDTMWNEREKTKKLSTSEKRNIN